eukprot:scaffold9622_cov58-Phaeocystis_antarctica.AAC.2
MLGRLACRGEAFWVLSRLLGSSIQLELDEVLVLQQLPHDLRVAVLARDHEHGASNSCRRLVERCGPEPLWKAVDVVQQGHHGLNRDIFGAFRIGLLARIHDTLNRR